MTAVSTYKFYSSKNGGDENSECGGETSTALMNVSILPSRTSDFFKKPSMKRKNKQLMLNSSRNTLNATSTFNKHIASAKKKAMNTSVMRQTLRSNNKALARALEIAKQEIKTLRENDLLQKSHIQELQTQINRLQDLETFESLFDKAVDECVKTKLAELMGDFDILLDETSQNIAKQMTSLSDACKKYLLEPEEKVEEVEVNARASSVGSASGEFVRRYSSQQRTVFDARRSVVGETSTASTNAPPPKQCDTFKRLSHKNSTPLGQKQFDLSAVLEQSNLQEDSVLNNDDILLEKLETVPESPDIKVKKRSTLIIPSVVRSKNRRTSSLHSAANFPDPPMSIQDKKRRTRSLLKATDAETPVEAAPSCDRSKTQVPKLCNVDILLDETAQNIAEQTTSLSGLCKKYLEHDEVVEEAEVNDRASSVGSASGEVVRRYSSQQRTVVGAIRSVVGETSTASTEALLPKPIEKLKRLSHKNSTPLGQKQFDLSAVHEQSNLQEDTVLNDDDLLLEKLEIVPESPDIKVKKRSTLLNPPVRSINRRTSSLLSVATFTDPQMSSQDKNRRTRSCRRKASDAETSAEAAPSSDRPKRHVPKLCYVEPRVASKLRRGDTVGFKKAKGT